MGSFTATRLPPPGVSAVQSDGGWAGQYWRHHSWKQHGLVDHPALQVRQHVLLFCLRMEHPTRLLAPASHSHTEAQYVLLAMVQPATAAISSPSSSACASAPYRRRWVTSTSLASFSPATSLPVSSSSQVCDPCTRAAGHGNGGFSRTLPPPAAHAHSLHMPTAPSNILLDQSLSMLPRCGLPPAALQRGPLH